MDKVAIFIDGGYISRVLQDEFNGQKIDFSKFSIELASGRNILRTYYYDCMPYQSTSPTQEEQNRYNNKNRFFSMLEKNSKFEVKKGKLAYRGVDSNTGKPIFEQKRVDLMLGLDIANLSIKGKISCAIIVAGDSDFIPAIEIAKNEGVEVHLVHGRVRHDDIWLLCDERHPIDAALISKVSR